MDVTMVLCDYAEAVNGKLYLSGAGWNALRANTPASVALGILVMVPWDRANEQHTMVLELVDEDGHRVQLGNPPQEVVQQGQFEAGRPAGWPPGSQLNMPLALRWPILPLPPGGYSFVLHIDDDEAGRVSFRAME